MVVQTDISDIAAIVDRMCREAYQRGYDDAVANILRAAKTAAPESDMRSPPKRATEGGRPRRQDRDAAVEDIVARAATGINQADIRIALQARSDPAPISSVGVVLGRLVAAGRIRKNGRVYISALGSSGAGTDGLVTGNTAPTPEPAKEDQVWNRLS